MRWGDRAGKAAAAAVVVVVVAVVVPGCWREVVQCSGVGDGGALLAQRVRILI